ncbi:DNA-binding response regulator KdpE [Cutibacterium acnes JCM 18918]|nr:DNA-binding response regulator KdpE [Cutibacterium acnes JCM 18918]
MAIDHKPDIILLDLGMPRLDGVKVIEAVRGWSSARSW